MKPGLEFLLPQVKGDWRNQVIKDDVVVLSKVKGRQAV
jgi:hypothetical protein